MRQWCFLRCHFWCRKFHRKLWITVTDMEQLWPLPFTRNTKGSILDTGVGWGMTGWIKRPAGRWQNRCRYSLLHLLALQTPRLVCHNLHKTPLPNADNYRALTDGSWPGREAANWARFQNFQLFFLLLGLAKAWPWTLAHFRRKKARAIMTFDV